jgi:hypothetical protein
MMHLDLLAATELQEQMDNYSKEKTNIQFISYFHTKEVLFYHLQLSFYTKLCGIMIGICALYF